MNHGKCHIHLILSKIHGFVRHLVVVNSTFYLYIINGLLIYLVFCNLKPNLRRCAQFFKYFADLYKICRMGGRYNQIVTCILYVRINKTLKCVR